MGRDLLADTLWINGRAVTVTPELLADALRIIERQVGVGRVVDQSEIAEVVVQLLHDRQKAATEGKRPAKATISISARDPEGAPAPAQDEEPVAP